MRRKNNDCLGKSAVCAALIFLLIAGCRRAPEERQSETVNVDSTQATEPTEEVRVESPKGAPFIDFSKLSEDELVKLIESTGGKCSDEAQVGFVRQCFKSLAKISLERAMALASKSDNEHFRSVALSGITAVIQADQGNQVNEADQKAAGIHSATEDLQSETRAEVDQKIIDLTRSDPKLAMEMVERITDAKQRELAQILLLKEWGTTAPMDAAEYALKQKRSFEMGAAIWELGENAARQDPVLALEKTANRPMSGLNDLYISATYGEWAKNDPVAAADGLAMIAHDKRVNNRVYRLVGEGYAQDPEKGKVWVQTIENPKEQGCAVKAFAANWAQADPDEASEWVNSLEDGRVYDTAAYSLADTFLDSTPHFAIEWAVSIQNNGMRNSQSKRIYNSWKLKDAEAAAQWLNSTDLISEDDRTLLGK